ncbi:Uncharacterized protein FWK35_00012490, partial [Aphis craccivora]
MDEAMPRYLKRLVFQLVTNLTQAKSFIIYNSERSEECIDFTMIITSQNNAPISNFGGGFRCKSEYPWCIVKTTYK